MSHEDCLLMVDAIKSIATACGGITVTLIGCAFVRCISDLLRTGK